MATKLSSALYDAQISGDEDAADKIRAEISNMHKPVPVRQKAHVISFNIVLNDDRSSAIVIYDFLNKAFGPDWWEWETETLEHMLWLKYSTALEKATRDKVFAIRHLCRSDRAFFDWYEFNQLCLSFSGAMADFEFLKQPSPGMIVAGVKTMLHIRPDREALFNKEVRKYICVILKDNGIYAPPPSLKELISEKFKEMLSSEAVALWPAIYDKYAKIVKKEDQEITESPADIQARRIFAAEASGLSYSMIRAD